MSFSITIKDNLDFSNSIQNHHVNYYMHSNSYPFYKASCSETMKTVM